MSIDKHTLVRLLDLLANCEQSPTSLEEIATHILTALQSPQAMQEAYGIDTQALDADHPSSSLLLALSYELNDYFALGDSVDEVWEEILAAFETPAMPAFPYEEMPFQDIESFFIWADQQLQLAHPEYGLIEFAANPEYVFQLILVQRQYISEILELCEQLGLTAASVLE